MFDRLCLIGVGLIGGSVARGARQRGLARSIVGLGREEDRQNLELAKQLEVIDEAFFDTDSALAGADLVVIATPVGVIPSVLAALKPWWRDDVVYMDVGSTKVNVIEALRQVFGFAPENFVPAHPIAGAEQSGVEAAVDDLFDNKRLILTPVPETGVAALSKVEQFWQRMGSLVSMMDAERHDAVLAATSHLPHLLAFTLVSMLGRQDEQSEIFKYAAGGFKDFTRIASSDPTMWADICTANHHQLIPLIRQLLRELELMEGLLSDGDYQRLFATFTYARNARQRFLDLLNHSYDENNHIQS